MSNESDMPWIVDLAERVAEGQVIDWEVEERRAPDPEQRKAIRGLRLLAQMASVSSHRVPAAIGPYSLLSKIGEGGMGEVWEAEQEEPIRRRVALKIIKRGMDTDRLIARFESERRALAMMDHPCIARVFEAGATEHGRPYFVMELVRGLPITEHCDRHRLSTRERLELFAKVCSGVQHAHQKAIIHRDIKPSNVLVTVHDGEPLPKIIDFGVAKAIEQRLLERTLFTEVGQVVGTPIYMSPEQASTTSADIDTRTDVYSLGVLLYELLVGTPPFDPRELRDAPFDEICRILREDDPPRPSSRAGSLAGTKDTIATSRSTEPRALVRSLRGDLDWITMKALEKDPSRRYQSPSQLAADIGRHMRHQPVLAGPPSTGYRARKFARRHRVGVSVGMVGLLVLVAFGTAMAVQARRIVSERDRANREADTASRVAEFMTGVFTLADPWASRGNRVTAVELLDRAFEQVRTDLKDEPVVRARMLHTIGAAYQGLTLYEQAIEALREAAEIRRNFLGTMHRDTLSTDHMLALSYLRLNRLDEAEELLRQTLARQRESLGADHEDALTTLLHCGLVASRRGDFATAAEMQERTVSGATRALGPEHALTSLAKSSLAHTYLNSWRLDEAESLVREVIDVRRRTLGENDVGTLEGMHVLGVTLRILGRFDEAEQVLREASDRLRGTIGEDHLYTIATSGDLAAVHYARGEYAEAERGFRKNHESYRNLLGSEHPRTLYALHRVGLVVYLQGRLEEARRIEEEALAGHRRAAGDDHPKTLTMIWTMTNICHELGNDDRARQLREEFLGAKRRQASRPDATPIDKHQYAHYLLTVEPTEPNDFPEALDFALEAARMSEFEDARILETLSLAYERNGDMEQAAAWAREARAKASDEGSLRAIDDPV